MAQKHLDRQLQSVKSHLRSLEDNAVIHWQQSMFFGKHQRKLRWWLQELHFESKLETLQRY
jgi:hypothetical protein